MATKNTATTAESTATPFVFEIPEGNFDEMVETFAKMVRRSRRTKTVPPAFTVIHEREEKIVRAIPNVYWADGKPEYEEVVTYKNYLYVTIDGERPRIAGWEFLATIDHTEGINVVKSMPGTGNIPVEYRQSLPVCNHCGTIRRRNETFVIRNAAGTYRQIGRNCLADFMPGDLADVLARLEWFAEAAELAGMAGDEDPDEPGQYGGRAERRYGLESFVALSAKVIDGVGWLSKTRAAETGQIATAGWITRVLSKPHRDDSRELLALRAAPVTEAHEQAARAAIEWAREIDPLTESDYLYNLYAITKGESFRDDRKGLVTSLIPAHRRFLDGEREKAERTANPSEWIGEIGKRDTFKGCTLTKIGTPSYGGYGPSTLLMFKMGSNVLKWWMSGVPDETWVVDQSYDLVGTPKAHGEYKGAKDTVVSRVKVAVEKPAKAKKEKKAKTA